MKPARSQRSSILAGRILKEENYDAPMRHLAANEYGFYGIPITRSEDRPSRARRSGSKLMSVLRSLTNSAVSSSSHGDIAASNAGTSELSKKNSFVFPRHEPLPTIVHRHLPTKTNAEALLDCLEKDCLLLDQTADSSTPTTSGDTSGKSSGGLGASTGQTSLESKFAPSIDTKVLSGHSSNNNQPKCLGDSAELPAIQEADWEVIEDEPAASPTVITVEKAAVTKIFFETHYNGLLNTPVTLRSLRRRELEGVLYDDIASSTAQKEAKRLSWARRETNHLRELRAMKSRPRVHLDSDKMAANYKVVKILGKGSFGVVRLVQERGQDDGIEGTKKERKEVYAMKVIRKSDMLRNSQEGHLRAERDFLVASEGSRWVVPLIASFQDAANLYLVMDYMPGGDFLGLLIRDNILDEAVTKWYIAEMILCIEEAHSLRWIHRDIKPDNFLISASGHLKISDFGLAFDGHWSHDQAYYNNHRYSLLTKLGLNVDGDTIDKKEGQTLAAAMKLANVLRGGKDRHEKKIAKSPTTSDEEGLLNWRNRTGNRSLARSVVGTSQYMAPEVVKGELYDARCDWWSVAIIIYECLYGHTPFLSEQGGRQETKKNIVNHKITFGFPKEPKVSHRCQDLIYRMIQEKSERLCSKRYLKKDVLSMNSTNRDYAGRYVYPNDAEDIKSHRWFKDIQWDRLHLMTPPFVPALKSSDDTQYFDEEEPISDFSSSHDEYIPEVPTEPEVEAALRGFNREIQVMAREYVVTAYDSTRLRKIEREIDGFTIHDEQKEYLRRFVRAYGRKEKKRPRDRLLRDPEFSGKVLELRKRGAFLGYSYKRIKKVGTTRARVDGVVGTRRVPSGGMDSKGKGKISWQRGRLSIH